jgi:hypothetical protein
MARFLIEVPHSTQTRECALAVEVFLRTGSHFLTHADWGCKDGDHKAWIIVDVESRQDARAVVPPAFRPQAKIVQLNTFGLDEIEQILRDHSA